MNRSRSTNQTPKSEDKHANKTYKSPNKPILPTINIYNENHAKSKAYAKVRQDSKSEVEEVEQVDSCCFMSCFYRGNK